MRSKSKSKRSNGDVFVEEMPGPSKSPVPSDAESKSEESPPTKRKKYVAGHKWKVWEKEEFINAFENTAPKMWLGKGLPSIEYCGEILECMSGKPRMQAVDVQRFMLKYMRRVKSNVQLTSTPIDKWLEVIDALSDEGRELEKQLGLVMMAAKQEPQDGTTPPGSFSPDMPLPNYEAIYEYFAYAFTDKPLPELSPIDSLVVEDCMQSLTFQIECLNDDDLRKSLRKVYLHMAQEPEEDLEHDQDEMKKNLLHNATALNPLGLNAQAILPVVPDHV